MRTLATFFATVAVSALAMPAIAQEAPPAANVTDEQGLDDIIVTAQKREQNLQDVPVAVSAVSGNELEAKNVTQFENLTSVSPSLTVTQGTNATGSSIILRGIGTFAVSIGVEPSVAVVVDDVAVLQQAQAFSNLADIERIEVLRGPQGTLFGKNASAGVVNIVTRDPSSELSGKIAAVATTDEEYRVEASLSGPLSEKVGFRLNGFFGDREGYIRNLATGSRLGGDRAWGIRGKLVADLTDAIRISVTASHSDSNGTGTPRSFRAAPAGSTIFGAPLAPGLAGITPGPDNYIVRNNFDPVANSEQTSVSGKLAFDLGGVTLTSITSYQDWSFYFFDDSEGTALPVTSPIGVTQASPFSAKQFAQEFRLASSGSGPLQYLVGLFYSDGDSGRSFIRGPNAQIANWTASTGTRSYAAFAQATYDLTETTHLDAGARYNREEIKVAFLNRVPPPPVPPANNATCLAQCRGANSDNAFTYKISLRQDLAERVMAYASYATGYKGQGFDVSTGFTPARALNPVNPETSKAYEIGLKSRFLDNRVQLNIAAFLNDYDDFQAQSVVQLTDLSLQFGLNNVGKLRTKGIEVELAAAPVDGLTLNVSAAYVDAKIRSFPTANCYTGQTAAQGCVDPDGAGPLGMVQNLAGKPLANSPKFKYAIGGSYKFPIPGTSIGGFVNLDWRHQNGVNFDLFQNPAFFQKAYGVVNGSIGITESEDKGYRISLFVNNLFDKHYTTNIGNQPGGSGDVLAQQLPRDSQQYFGVRAAYSF